MSILCLVTDRRRLPAAYGSDDSSRLVCQVAAAAGAGIDLVQIRERDLDGGPLAELVTRCLAAVSGSKAKVLVNERVDVAIGSGAHGVHLRGDSMSAERVRTLAPGAFTVGRSVHAIDEAEREAKAGGLDFLVIGPVFPTQSKSASSTWFGADAVGELAGRVSVPVLAIGGIDLANLASIARTGAAGVAAIGLFADAPHPAALEKIVADARKTFDMSRART